MGSWQNLFQCNKNLSKHQTKINTTIKLTYYKRTESSKVQFITKNRLKIVYKIICVQKQSSQGVLQKDVLKTRSNPQENKRAEKRSQLSWFTILLKSQPRTDAPPKIHCTHAAHTQNTIFHVRRVLKDLIYKKLLFTVIKRNLHSSYITFYIR